jgi:hypothetical protein
MSMGSTRHRRVVLQVTGYFQFTKSLQAQYVHGADSTQTSSTRGYWILSIYQVHSAAYVHGVDSASGINEYEEYSLGVKRCRRVRMKTSSLLSRKCESLDINLMGLHGLLQGWLYSFAIKNTFNVQKRPNGTDIIQELIHHTTVKKQCSNFSKLSNYLMIAMKGRNTT